MYQSQLLLFIHHSLFNSSCRQTALVWFNTGTFAERHTSDSGWSPVKLQTINSAHSVPVGLVNHMWLLSRSPHRMWPHLSYLWLVTKFEMEKNPKVWVCTSSWGNAKVYRNVHNLATVWKALSWVPLKRGLERVETETPQREVCVCVLLL